MRQITIADDPLLPKCLVEHPSLSTQADIWVMESIRKLNPNWWQRLSDGYDENFNHHGCYKPHQELNKRKRQANAWLLDKVIRFA